MGKQMLVSARRVGGGKKLGAMLTAVGYRQVTVQTDRYTDEYTGIVVASWGAGAKRWKVNGGYRLYVARRNLNIMGGR